MSEIIIGAAPFVADGALTKIDAIAYIMSTWGILVIVGLFFLFIVFLVIVGVWQLVLYISGGRKSKKPKNGKGNTPELLEDETLLITDSDKQITKIDKLSLAELGIIAAIAIGVVVLSGRRNAD